MLCEASLFSKGSDIRKHNTETLALSDVTITEFNVSDVQDAAKKHKSADLAFATAVTQVIMERIDKRVYTSPGIPTAQYCDVPRLYIIASMN